ncbi:uncharacterized protein TNCV_3513991 [Trichonephila clavipes]|nr:uncharacterized protein TNCV_3513991 [Trichonephila clavipes]
MARKRAENRERSLGHPGFVKPVFTKDSKPLWEKKKITRAPRERETRTHLKKAPLHAIHVVRRRRIHEADISTPVAVDQRTAKCLEEAVRLFTAIWSRCRSSRADINFRHPLPAFRVVRDSSVHCFLTHFTVELFRCTHAPIG